MGPRGWPEQFARIERLRTEARAVRREQILTQEHWYTVVGKIVRRANLSHLPRLVLVQGRSEISRDDRDRIPNVQD